MAVLMVTVVMGIMVVIVGCMSVTVNMIVGMAVGVSVMSMLVGMRMGMFMIQMHGIHSFLLAIWLYYIAKQLACHPFFPGRNRKKLL